MEPYSICSSVSSFFAQYSIWDYSNAVLSVVCSYLLVHSIPLPAYATIYLHLLLMYLWVVSSLGLLWRKLLRIFVYISVGRPMYSFLLCIHFVELLGYRIDVYLAIGDTASFPKWLYQCTLLPEMYKSSRWSTSLAALGIVNHFNFSHSGWFVVVSYSFNLRFPDE